MTLHVSAAELALEPEPLLSVDGVSRFYGERIGCADVSFDLWPGEVLGIVGESGSGKSTLLRCLAGIDKPDEGEVLFRGSERTARHLLGRRAGAPPPDAHSLGHRPPEPARRVAHGRLRRRQCRRAPDGSRRPPLRKDPRARARLAPARRDRRHRIDDRPRQFSGGMQQRLQIARVLVSEPRLVFMDEPTGGLDVSVQARLLDLLRVLVRDLGLAAIIVTHDLAVARLLTDRLMVMKDGRVVEQGLTDQVLDDPHHAYTQLLTSAVLSV
jgi:putative phosphonate transport system ATP-binding protein